MALVVDSETFTAESLAADITTVVTDANYRANAQKVSAVMKDTPKPPVELAADWIEYGIRHDGALFHQVDALTPWYIHWGLDVGAALFLCNVVLPVLMVRWLCLCCCGGKAAKKSKNE